MAMVYGQPFWQNVSTPWLIPIIFNFKDNTSNNHGKDIGSRYAFSICDGDTEVIPGGSERGNILV